MSATDYRKYYYLERYLFDEVTVRFEKEKSLTAFDFFCIIIWKANRAKSKVAERLLSQGFDDLDRAVSSLMNAIATAQDDKAKLRVLIADWGFRLPMASAILTVLYPTVFTIYDVRVCDVLGNFRNTQYRTNFDALWAEYQAYVEAVRNVPTEKYDLRDKDRWLWGKSFCEQLKEDMSMQFKKVREADEPEA